MVAVGENMRSFGHYASEEVVRLGDDDHVVSILTLPDAALDPSTPAVLVLNAGVLHRVGPHRLHVALARRLAGLGLPVLRLDLSGIGDSSAGAASMSFRESSVADTRAAMDLLGQRLGTRRFVLFGVCSGADNAMAAAAVDDRVVGLVLIDSYSYATTKSGLRADLAKARRLASPREFAAWTSRRLGSVGARLMGSGPHAERSAASASGEPTQEGRVAPPLETYRSMVSGFLERNVAMLMVFSGVLRERYNDADQIFEWWPEARGRIERAYFPKSNHTFTTLAMQADLIGTVAAWFERFSAARAGAASAPPR